MQLKARRIQDKFIIAELEQGERRRNKTYPMTSFGLNFFESTLRQHAATVAQETKPCRSKETEMDVNRLKAEELIQQ